MALRIPGVVADIAVGLLVAGFLIGAVVPVAADRIGPRTAVAAALLLVVCAVVVGRAVRKSIDQRSP